MAKHREEEYEEEDVSTPDAVELEDEDYPVSHKDYVEGPKKQVEVTNFIRLSNIALLYILIGVVSLTLSLTTICLHRKICKIQETLHHEMMYNRTQQNQQPHGHTCPGCAEKQRQQQMVSDDKGSGSHNVPDWMSFKGTKGTRSAFEGLDPNAQYDLPNLGIHEIYHVRRDMTGKITDVQKQGDYLG